MLNSFFYVKIWKRSSKLYCHFQLAFLFFVMFSVLIIYLQIRQQEYLTALPLCSLPFHWPRVDLDQLLSVKILDIDHCRWSGGFYIDRINSFHINMRQVLWKVLYGRLWQGSKLLSETALSVSMFTGIFFKYYTCSPQRSMWNLPSA